MPFVLPHRYRYAHRYALFLYDLILAKLLAGMRHHIFDVQFRVKKRLKGPVPRHGDELYRWLEKHYGAALTAEMDYKLVTRALLDDFCHFVLEGLRASGKGKLTVAYALFRKPFKDNLFYCEWLLADPTDFITRFKTQDPESVEVTRLSRERRIELIGKAVRLAGGQEDQCEFIHDLRYDRSAPYGLAVPWDQATHLVTTFKQARTEKQNFNFVFSGPREWETQWHQVYQIVPLLLSHSVYVVDALLATIAKVPREYDEMKRMRQHVGFVAWADSMEMGGSQGTPEAKDLAAAFLDIALACAHCGTALRLHRRNMRAFALRGSLRCPTCRTPVQLDTSDESPS